MRSDNRDIPQNEPIPELPQRCRRENWLALAAFVVVTALAGQTLQGMRAQKSDEHEQRLIISIRGDNLYKAYCSTCHGVDAKGNGPMAAWLKVQPTDLTRIAARNGGKFPLERVDRIISGEEALQSGHGTQAMPVWGPVFSQVTLDQDLGRVRIDNLARYLRDIQNK
jgi:mono/diheme cytochrome c family protein